MDVRDAGESEVEALARLWWDGWRDAHAEILPPEFIRLRTRQSFTDRLAAALGAVRAAGPVDAPLGFHLVKGEELNQFYVAAAARGTGLARALIDDAEARLAAAGVRRAFLSCAIGNDRAARFYEKCGWERMGVVTDRLTMQDGTIFDLDVWRYEKDLPAG
ncbi:MAG: GNAT family N-acetyltransferase [Pseudomonadota bacterium]|nr:GNAT family N-acetyltransferase [Pseudomonadota bacterium]